MNADRIRRTRLDAAQLDLLEHSFALDPMPSIDDRNALADQLGLDTKKVSSWFQNRRQKIKHSASDINATQSSTTKQLDAPLPHPAPASLLSGTDDHDNNNNIIIPSSNLSIANNNSISASRATPSLSGYIYHRPSHPLSPPTSPQTTTISPQHRQLQLKLEHQEPDYYHDQMPSSPAASSKTYSPPPPSEASSNATHAHHSPNMKAPHQRTSTRARSARQASSSALPPSATPIPSSLHNHQRDPDAKLTRVRLQPYQLEVLKRYYAHDTNPSMEKRMEIGVEVDMHVSRVTNWFRNLRQAEKTKKKSSSGTGAGARKSEAMDDDEADDASEASQSVPPTTAPSHFTKGRLTRNSQAAHDDAHVWESLSPYQKPSVPSPSIEVEEDMDIDDNDDEDEDDELATPEPTTPPQHPHSHQSHSHTNAHTLPSLSNLIHAIDQHPTLPPLHSIPGYARPHPLVQVTSPSPLSHSLPHARAAESAVSVRSPDYFAASGGINHHDHDSVSAEDSYADFNKEDKEGALLLLHFAGIRIMPNSVHRDSHVHEHHGHHHRETGRLVDAL
ncbi:homeobox-domain-containing protein [Sistotremastrum niveocremeum HHB9708]|uniref:Homeobox-domain-containing protein n=1 Tax=Sistotremastrum niveocremeum HHB9708 TaxID=1314777 RepID=A0A164SNU6_9AGAM|nr:homeobox-domain-containing protein [Sistotremastrum niveocremeum HHB9708]